MNEDLKTNLRHAGCTNALADMALDRIETLERELVDVAKERDEYRMKYRIKAEGSDRMSRIASEMESTLLDIVSAYEFRCELYTSDQECATALADKARAALAGKGEKG